MRLLRLGRHWTRYAVLWAQDIGFMLRHLPEIPNPSTHILALVLLPRGQRCS